MIGGPRAPQLIRLEQTPSTNDEVRRRWDGDPSSATFPHLSTITTLQQTAGRGRLGRTWIAPPGACLALSTIVRLDASASSWLGWLPLVAGLALRDAIELEFAAAEVEAEASEAQSAGSDGGINADSDANRRVAPTRRVRVKWPNDVLIDGRKVSGILGEMLGVRDGELACVIGTGINLRLRAEELPVPHATSLALAGISAPNDERLERRYLDGLATRIDSLVAALGDAVAAGVHRDFEDACDTIGRRIRVALPGGDAIVGVAVGVDASGQLLVRDDHGSTRAVAAGDVERVRPSD